MAAMSLFVRRYGLQLKRNCELQFVCKSLWITVGMTAVYLYIGKTAYVCIVVWSTVGSAMMIAVCLYSGENCNV